MSRHIYNPQVLIGNWYEDRVSKSSQSQRPILSSPFDYLYKTTTSSSFVSRPSTSPSNTSNSFSDRFCTTTSVSFVDPKQLKPKPGPFDRMNPKFLDSYRSTWTKGPKTCRFVSECHGSYGSFTKSSH
ncbi:hypothetical protein RCL1_005831 [Eukaryota sp. TZLM3-RCL]